MTRRQTIDCFQGYLSLVTSGATIEGHFTTIPALAGLWIPWPAVIIVAGLEQIVLRGTADAHCRNAIGRVVG